MECKVSEQQVFQDDDGVRKAIGKEVEFVKKWENVLDNTNDEFLRRHSE